MLQQCFLHGTEQINQNNNTVLVLCCKIYVPPLKYVLQQANKLITYNITYLSNICSTWSKAFTNMLNFEM